MLNMFGIIFQGWGFCNKVCKEDYDIWVNRLRMVKLTILSDKMCKEIGNSPKDIHGEGEFVVNVRKELCGAFVNDVNVTFVNYTLKIFKKKNSNKLSDILKTQPNIYLS